MSDLYFDAFLLQLEESDDGVEVLHLLFLHINDDVCGLGIFDASQNQCLQIHFIE